MKRGTQKRLPAFSGKREYIHLAGAYNWRTGQVSTLRVERKNGETFLAFLEQLLFQTYADQAVILVLDNAAYHHSQAVHALLSLLEHRVRVLWLPVYCPELNMIERFWKHLKYHACANKLYPSLESLWANVLHLLQQQNEPSCPERLVFHKHFR